MLNTCAYGFALGPYMVHFLYLLYIYSWILLYDYLFKSLLHMRNAQLSRFLEMEIYLHK